MVMRVVTAKPFTSAVGAPVFITVTIDLVDECAEQVPMPMSVTRPAGLVMIALL
jgi:hypothetical protein